MSREQLSAVRLSPDDHVGELLRDVEAGYRRAEKSEPGERTEVAAYEALCAALEMKAAAALLDGSGTQVDVPERTATTAGLFIRSRDGVVVVLTLPLEPGALVREAAGQAPPEPAAPVEIRDDIWGRRLVVERLRSQLEAAIAAPGKDRSSALSPSGVHNRVLTEVLREYVASKGNAPVSVPVVYRDGSRATSGASLK